MAVWCDSSFARGNVGKCPTSRFQIYSNPKYTPSNPEQALIEVLAPGGEGIQGRGEVLFPPQSGLQGARIPYPPAPQPHGPGCLPWYTHLRRRPATRARRPRLALCHGVFPCIHTAYQHKFCGAGQRSQIRKRCSSWTRLTLCVTGLDKREHAQCVVDSAESGLACMPGIHMPALCFKVLAGNVNHVKGDILWSTVVSAAVQACMGGGRRHDNRCWRAQISFTTFRA